MGSRVYAYVKDSKDIIRIDFRQARLLGAEYVISKFSISNSMLQSICEKCNNSSELFLYKIIKI